MKRNIFFEIYNHLNEKEYSIITGARQTGKTTVLRQLEETLKSENKPVFYLTLEDPEILMALNNHPENVFNFFSVNGKEKSYLLIDEIQYLDNPTNFLKLLYDKYASVLKLIVTGSSAFYIDKKFKDSLSGRKRLFILTTMDFDEFLLFKTGDNELVGELNKIRENEKYRSLHRRKIKTFFNEYLIFGGYPAVVLSENTDRKKEILKDIFHSYLKKDIAESNVRDEQKFYEILLVLSNQTGNMLNIHELSNTLRISVTAAENYIYILQKSFHIDLIRPYHKNIRKELTKMPKLYFNDLGFRNTVISNYQNIDVRADRGALIENYAYIRLRKQYGVENIKFWRTSTGNEIDFVIDGIKTAIETKYNISALKMSKYKKFIQTYPEYKFYVRAFVAENNSTDIMAL